MSFDSFDCVALERGQELLVEDTVLVDSQHARGCGEREGSALVPERNAVVFDQEGSEWVADLVCIVSVRDVETHQHQLFHVNERCDPKLLEGPREEHVSEDNVGLEEEAVDRPPVELQRAVRASHPNGNVRGRRDGTEMRAMLLHVCAEAAEQVGESPLSLRYSCGSADGRGSDDGAIG